MQSIDWTTFTTPILLQGHAAVAYRDPTAVYHRGEFWLYYTMVETEAEGDVYLYTAMSRSKDLMHWTEPKKLTPRDKKLNFSSPGNLIRHDGKWKLCLQTYPRPNGEKWGTDDSRIWLMESDDLEEWGEPRLLRVKGDETPDPEMGRMIDPYLVEDKDEPGKWWCFYKQNGVSLSYSRDLIHWSYFGRRKAGENVCVLVKDDRYWMFHSPHNGIGLMTSTDLDNWEAAGDPLTLGQQEWDWARGRLTAGFILDLTEDSKFGKYIMFFHGSGPEDERVIFDTHACIGFAWSDDLLHWSWPGTVRSE